MRPLQILSHSNSRVPGLMINRARIRIMPMYITSRLPLYRMTTSHSLLKWYSTKTLILQIRIFRTLLGRIPRHRTDLSTHSHRQLKTNNSPKISTLTRIWGNSSIFRIQIAQAKLSHKQITLPICPRLIIIISLHSNRWRLRL